MGTLSPLWKKKSFSNNDIVQDNQPHRFALRLSAPHISRYPFVEF